jgi:hypothetical protein
MLQKGLWDNGKDENNNFFCGVYLLDYKMAISNHTLGDYITIKTIIENSDISYNKYPKKSKISIKQTTNPNSIISAFHF